ncbi:hypothetical protein [Laspinema palackyanum]|uniref:hypothetical protein n=1 Tax=Laspinema palackyanum TaxID=3231601 RepID=UPI00345D0753|nr:hypothetical protein [Laspinema sp. D2c]
MTQATETNNKTVKNNIIDDSALGYQVSDYSERLYRQVYYALREEVGFIAKVGSKEKFDWKQYKQNFAKTFGTPENRKYTLKQLLEYAQVKLGKNLEQLLETNRKSCQRYQDYQNRFHQDEEELDEIPH